MSLIVTASALRPTTVPTIWGPYRLAPLGPVSILDGEAQVRVTYHPSALTRNPEWPGPFDEDIGWLGEI